MNTDSILENIFLTLPFISDRHAPNSALYEFFKKIARREVEDLFYTEKEKINEFKPFGDIVFPYKKMGAIDSLNLFDLDELIIFSFYWANRKKYRHILDIGANLGLHSILLSKCGFEVRSYEPDPKHFEILKRNITLNNCLNVQLFNSAVSSKNGEMEFIRVLGNTTSSHLAGSKSHPYGDLERFPVKVEAIGRLMDWAELIKLDAEGHEKEILLATSRNDWEKTDALVEIGSEENATALYDHFRDFGINLFAQKINWNLVHSIKDMPTSYHDGTLFITSKDQMFWV